MHVKLVRFKALVHREYLIHCYISFLVYNPSLIDVSV